MRYLFIAIGFSAAVFGTAACTATGSQSVPTPPVDPNQALGQMRATLPLSALQQQHRMVVSAGIDARSCPAGRVYVADYFNSSINVFPSGKPLRPKPCGHITQGILGPSGISVGQDGSLYVSDYEFSAVTEYPRGSLKPSRKIFTAGKPQYAYVGVDGTLYVSESYSNQVEEFAPGSKKPVRTISITYPWGVATDSANNLYVTSNVYTGSNYVGHIVEYPPGSTTGTDLGITIGFVLGMKLAKDDSIVVGDGGNVDVLPARCDHPEPHVPHRRTVRYSSRRTREAAFRCIVS